MNYKVGRTHHIKLGSYYYVLKLDAKSPFEFYSQYPFVNRQSVAESRNEGEYTQDLTFTQSSFAKGQGQFYMVPGGEERYYESQGIDVSGKVRNGLCVVNSVEQIADVSIDFGVASDTIVIMKAHPLGVMVAYPAMTNDSGYRYLRSYDGNNWGNAVAIGGTNPSYFDGKMLLSMVCAGGYTFTSFENAVARNDLLVGLTDYVHDPDNTSAPLTWLDALITDGKKIYGARIEFEDNTGTARTNIYSFPIHGTAPVIATKHTTSPVEGKVNAMECHNGEIYALAELTSKVTINGVTSDYYPDLSVLYKLVGNEFVPWKKFPEGFKGQSLASDGTNLYIAGCQKSVEGNYRGQVYYLTGSSSSEILGNLGTFGRKGTAPDYDIWTIATHGNSVYFPYLDYGGFIRYDSEVGGFSLSYADQTNTSGVINKACFYKGGLYFVKNAYGAIPTRIYRVLPQYTVSNIPNNFLVTPYLKTSYYHFGFPKTQKLYLSVTIIADGVYPDTYGNTFKVYYAVDGTNDYIDLGSIGTPSSESSPGFYKYNIPFYDSSGNLGIKAHSISLKIEFIIGSGSDEAPVIKMVSINAMPLIIPPGKNKPNKEWKFNIVNAKKVKTLDGRIDPIPTKTKLEELRSLRDSQKPTQLITMAEPDKTYNVVVMNISEVPFSYPRGHPDSEYEATIAVELKEV